MRQSSWNLFRMFKLTQIAGIPGPSLLKGALMIESVILVSPESSDIRDSLRVITDNDITCFETGAAALDYLSLYPNQDSVIVIDATVPDDTLVHLVSRINTLSPMMVIVVVISDSDPDLTVALVKAGASTFIPPEAGPEALFSSVRDILSYESLISHLQQQINTVSDKGLMRRIKGFEQIVQLRHSRGEAIRPSEIQLFFPASDEIPTDQLLALIESRSLPDVSKTLAYKPRLLIVEDEPILNEVMIGIMEPEYDVIAVSTAEDAILAIENNPEFDLMLLDICLPGMNGDELVKDLKERSPQLHIMMVTGITDSGSIIRCLRAGASDYIVKPFDVVALSDKAANLVQTQLTMTWLKRYLNAI